jgi:hypothetical protein
MVIRAQISVYPLRQPHLRPAVDTVLAEMEGRGLGLEPGPMMRGAFARVAETGDVVMVVTFSNACPA